MILLQEVTALCGVLPLQQWLLQFQGRNDQDLGTSALFPSLQKEKEKEKEIDMERGKEWDRGRKREDNVMSVSFQSPRGNTGRLLISSYTLRFIFCYFSLIPFFYLFDSPSFLCLFNSHFYCYLPFNHIFYFSHFSYSNVPPLLVF